MDAVWGILFFFLGYMLFTWSTMQIVLSITCGFKMLAVFRHLGVSHSPRIAGSFRSTVLIHVAIGGLVWWAVLTFAPQAGVVGFLVGSGLAFLVSLRKWGLNAVNVSEFLHMWENHFDKDTFVSKAKEAGFLPNEANL